MTSLGVYKNRFSESFPPVESYQFSNNLFFVASRNREAFLLVETPRKSKFEDVQARHDVPVRLQQVKLSFSSVKSTFDNELAMSVFARMLFVIKIRSVESRCNRCMS